MKIQTSRPDPAFRIPRWLTASHFSSWFALAPGTKISGGKRLSGKTKPSANRAAEVFRLDALINIHRLGLHVTMHIAA